MSSLDYFETLPEMLSFNLVYPLLLVEPFFCYVLSFFIGYFSFLLGLIWVFGGGSIGFFISTFEYTCV